jgi:hypothetical protein
VAGVGVPAGSNSKTWNTSAWCGLSRLAT